MSDERLLFIIIFLGVVIAIALVALVWKMRDLATRGELRKTEERLDRDIKETRREANEEVKGVHERLDDLIKPVGEMRGEMTGIKESLSQILSKLP